MSINTSLKIVPVILAAGDGKRMQSDLPKVMHLLKGKPLIDHVVSAVEKTQFLRKPTVVVSPKHNLVQDYLKDRANYVVQSQQLGTGHAVMQTQGSLHTVADHIVILYGDMPFISATAIEMLVQEHVTSGNTLTLVTTTVPSFADEYACFAGFGRIVRDSASRIAKNVEAKDASEGELLIREVNPAIFCFKAEWLWNHLQFLEKSNVQSEYYLTDLVGLAIADGQLVSSISVDPREAMGINSKADLERAEKIV